MLRWLKEMVMSATRSLSVTLPSNLADELEARVAAGDYASESEMVREGLYLLLEQRTDVAAWLETEVAATYDAFRQNPSRAIAAEEVLSRLEQRFAADRAAPRDT